MAVLNVEWCDFVVYSKGVVVVDRILADYNYWTELSEILDSFYVQYVVPEILSCSLLKNIVLFEIIMITTILVSKQLAGHQN